MSSCDTLARCANELDRQRRYEIADVVRALCVVTSRPDGDAIVSAIRGKVFQALREPPGDAAWETAFRRMLELSLRRPEGKVVPFPREGNK